jgi:hypothetical protein
MQHTSAQFCAKIFTNFDLTLLSLSLLFTHPSALADWNKWLSILEWQRSLHTVRYTAVIFYYKPNWTFTSPHFVTRDGCYCSVAPVSFHILSHCPFLWDKTNSCAINMDVRLQNWKLIMITLSQKQTATNWALRSNKVGVVALLYSVVKGFIIIKHIVLH